eukprot:7774282-Alexandrium_andersonii.AAC.1
MDPRQQLSSDPSSVTKKRVANHTCDPSIPTAKHAAQADNSEPEPAAASGHPKPGPRTNQTIPRLGQQCH